MNRITTIVSALLFVGLTYGCTAADKQEKKKTEMQADSNKVTKMESDSTGSLIRDPNNKIVTLETNFGKMTLELYRDVAPAHADSFVARSLDGFYEGTVFHRIVASFMIQGGDPTGTGRGDAGYNIDAEFNKLPHKDGTLSMARARDINSASCQFFICLGRNRTTSNLDGKYTVFGQLINGFDVLHKIGQVKTGPSPSGENSKPLEEIKILKTYLSDKDGNPLK